MKKEEPHQHMDDQGADLCPICNHPRDVYRKLKHMPQQELDDWLAFLRADGWPEMADYYINLLEYGDQREVN